MRLSNPIRWKEALFVITHCPVTFLPALKNVADDRLKELESPATEGAGMQSGHAQQQQDAIALLKKIRLFLTGPSTTIEREELTVEIDAVIAQQHPC